MTVFVCVGVVTVVVFAGAVVVCVWVTVLTGVVSLLVVFAEVVAVEAARLIALEPNPQQTIVAMPSALMHKAHLLGWGWDVVGRPTRDRTRI